MENNIPNSSQKNETNPTGEKEKIGSLVERLRSYEHDVARLKGLPLEEPEKKQDWNFVEKEQPRKSFEVAGKMEPSVKNPGKTFESLEASNIIPEPEKATDQKEAVENLHKEILIPRSRTIQTDIIDNSKNHETTIADIIKAEEEKTKIPLKEIEDPKRGIYILVLSATLIVAGALGFTVFYKIKTSPQKPPQIATNPDAIIEIKKSQDLVLSSGKSAKDSLLELRSQLSGTTEKMIMINMEEGTSTPVKAERFLRLFSDSVPAWFVRSLKPQYVVGMYNLNNSWQPFIIFKTTSYDTAYSGMLAWEETMEKDFKDFTLSTKTPTNIKQINSGFRDTIIKNKDVRVFQDDFGRKTILYSFPEKETLVITTNQAVLEAIFAQLNTSKFVQ